MCQLVPQYPQFTPRFDIAKLRIEVLNFVSDSDPQPMDDPSVVKIGEISLSVSLLYQNSKFRKKGDEFHDGTAN